MNDETVLEWTDYGYAYRGENPPKRQDVHWITPMEHIYAWDGDGWFRIRPPDRKQYPKGDLNHG